MAMTTQINQLTGASPTYTSVNSTTVIWNRADSTTGTTAIPTPTSTGTNFSWVKTFQMEITVTGGLTMTNILVGKVTAEADAVALKLWRYTGHAVGAYVQASAPPTATGDNNTTAPTINSATGVAFELISAPPSAYAAGGYSSVAKVGNIVEVVLGVSATNATAGTAVSCPSLRWSWTEA